MLGLITRSRSGDYLSGAGLCFVLLFWSTSSWSQPLAAIFVADQQATLAAERASVLKEFTVKIGDRVKKGQLLAVFADDYRTETAESCPASSEAVSTDASN